MGQLTESARQYLVSQGIVIGTISVLSSLSLLLTGVVVITRASDILQFTSLIHLAVLHLVCGAPSVIVVAFVWWTVVGYRNRQMEIRSKYLDDNLTKGLIALFIPVFLNYSAFLVSVVFLIVKTETTSRHEMRNSMSLYTSDMSEKVLIDRLQIILRCCGSQSIMDWFLIDWQAVAVLRQLYVSNSLRVPDDEPGDSVRGYLPPDRNRDSFSLTAVLPIGLHPVGLTTRAVAAMLLLFHPYIQHTAKSLLRYNSSTDWDSVPFSCCCPEAPPPCVHQRLRIFGVSSLYDSGCAEKLDRAVLIFIIVSLVIFFITSLTMSLLMYSSRKLQTSARSAVDKGDATAPGDWWILGPTGNTRKEEEPLLGKRGHDEDASPNVTTEDGRSNRFRRNHELVYFQKSKIIDSTINEDWATYNSASMQPDMASSDDWPVAVNNGPSQSTSASSIVTGSVLCNYSADSRRSVSDTAVANLEVSHHFEHKIRPLYRS